MISPTPAGEDNCIYVGEKPFMNYVAAIIMQFTTQEQPTVRIKARGKHISRAVDVSEVAIKDFLEGEANIQEMTSTSEQVRNREGKQVRVSTVDITLARQ
ncbi:MAG: DNA/RNA-binding protein AlbA [Candidatus Woesearchaeota archaeon]